MSAGKRGVYPSPGDGSEPVADTAGLLLGWAFFPVRPELLFVPRAGWKGPGGAALGRRQGEAVDG